MHDIDRAMYEMEQQEQRLHERGGANGGSYETLEMSASGELNEMEMASELLEASLQGELEQFIGDLVKSAASAVGGFANSAAGKAVGGILKDAARRVLPTVGQALGNAVAPGVGGGIGERAGRWLGSQFEFEGLSAEDREFEAARAFVRFANDAVQSAATAPAGVDPGRAAQAAAVQAAQRTLPGLVPVLKQMTSTGSSASGGRATSGRWVRHQGRIVLLGV